jgi:hypothetical protein
MVGLKMINSKSIIAVLATSLMLSACGSNPTKTQSQSMPDWIVNEPAQAGHAYGVGSAQVYTDSAEALQRARNAARVSMVQKLKVTVGGSFSQDIKESRQTGQQTMLVQTVRNTITSSIPDAQFDNLEVQENFVGDGVAYSLVHLDRVKATSLLRRRIAELDLQATSLDASVSSNLPTLKQLQGLLPALTFIEQREQLADQAELVDVNSRRPRKDDMLVTLEKRIQVLLDSLVVTLSASDQQGKTIRSGLSQYLTDLGLRISNSQGDLQLVYGAQLRAVEKGGRFIVFASGQVQIKDDAGRLLSEFSKEAKGVSGASSAQAQVKAVQNLAESLGKELAASLLQKID